MKVSSVQPTAKFHSAKQTVRSKAQKAVSPELTERHLKAPCFVKSGSNQNPFKSAKEISAEVFKEDPEEAGAKLRKNWSLADKAANRELTQRISQNAADLALNSDHPNNKKPSDNLDLTNAPKPKPVNWNELRNGVGNTTTNRQIQQLPSEKPNPTSDATVKTDPKQVVASLEEETNLEARNQEPGIKQKSPNIQRIGF